LSTSTKPSDLYTKNLNEIEVWEEGREAATMGAEISCCTTAEKEYEAERGEDCI